MKVLVASSAVPNVFGGGRNIVEWTVDALKRRGHDVDTLIMPHDPSPAIQREQMIAWRLTPIPEQVDRLICIRWPANLLLHRHKSVWFIHHLRSFFDLADTEFGVKMGLPQERQTQAWMRHLDTQSLQEADRIFANSETVAQRIWKYNGIRVPILFPPLKECSGSPKIVNQSQGSHEFILVLGRVTHGKRTLLALEALAQTTSAVRMVIAGVPEDPAYADKIKALAESNALRERVLLRLEWVSEEEKELLLRDCLCVAYLPLDEDSYGYPTLEAAKHGKCVVTTSDSGGVQEFLEDGVNGLVVPPTVSALSKSFDRLYRDQRLAANLGAVNNKTCGSDAINWDTVVDGLLGRSS